jgi:exonuclease SbcC
VTDKLERTLGMTHSEFFNTYFTGQKELAVMASLGKTERAAFLSQVLGYERLRLAQERVREVRNALTAELRGLETALPDPQALAQQRRGAEERLAATRRAAQAADAVRDKAQEACTREEPRWNAWVARRERTLSLDGERRMAEHARGGAASRLSASRPGAGRRLQAREQLKQLEWSSVPRCPAQAGARGARAAAAGGRRTARRPGPAGRVGAHDAGMERCGSGELADAEAAHAQAEQEGGRAGRGAAGGRAGGRRAARRLGGRRNTRPPSGPSCSSSTTM